MNAWAQMRSSESSQRCWLWRALQLRRSSPVAQQVPIAVPQPIACPTGTRSSREYAFNLMGNRAGYQTVCLQADGTRVVHFAFNDRGRGPALTSKIQLDAKGVPVAIATDGNDYLKSPVAERFTRAAGTATWQNKVESGTRPVAGAAFYVSQSGSFEEIGLLARALRDAPGRKLPLLPQGEADLQQLSQLQIGNGEIFPPGQPVFDRRPGVPAHQPLARRGRRIVRDVRQLFDARA